MISIIIPIKNEPYAQKTIDTLLEKAKGEIEIIPIIDGTDETVSENTRVNPIYFDDNKGMRTAIDVGISKARGDWIMKLDAHCLVAEGFDEVLKRDCKKNWLMIPRRYPLNLEKWSRGTGSKTKDYHYIANREDGIHNSLEWKEKYDERKDHMIDDVMAMQGSCWFANKEFFLKIVGKLDNERYHNLGGENLEIVLKYWSRGGEVKVNKNTWYAHLFKNMRYYKEHNIHRENSKIKGYLEGYRRVAEDYPKEIKDLVKRFRPVPGW